MTMSVISARYANGLISYLRKKMDEEKLIYRGNGVFRKQSDEDALIERWNEAQDTAIGIFKEEKKKARYHYKRLVPEPITVINAWDLNFNAGNVVKYIARYQYKGDAIGDLEKAIQYISFEIDRIRNRQEGQTQQGD